MSRIGWLVWQRKLLTHRVSTAILQPFSDMNDSRLFV